MTRALFFVLLGLAVSCGSYALQETEKSTLCECEELQELLLQVKDLQKNVTELWTYIYSLRNAMASQLRHLRDHQVQAEHQIDDLTHQRGHSMDSYHGHSHQDSGEHDHHAEESAHHDHHSESSGHDHHSGESTHHDDHHHHEDSSHSHQDESAHHGDHDHHDESGHGDDHHHHDDHDSSSHGHSHEVTDHHHHHDDHSSEDKKDEVSKEKKEEIAEKVVVAATHRHHHHDHSNDFRVGSARSHSHGHHGHHDHSSTVNKTVVFPKPSEQSQYRFATCRVESNQAIPEDQQQDVRGEVTFWQRKTGGPLGIHVRLQGFKMGGHHGQQVQTEDDGETAEVGNQHTMGHRHGFHVHASSDMSSGCQSMGPHFNPEGVNHGGPSSAER